MESTLALSDELASTEYHDEFVIDFSRIGTTEPFGMLLAASEIRRLAKRFPSARLSCINFNRMTYAAHMGFFQSFGLDFGNHPGQAKGNERYLPITILQCEALRRQAVEAGSEVGEIVEIKSKQLAAMLCGDSAGPVHESLAYSIRELMRNVIEHSNAMQFGLCAQYWPSKKKVEVAILDRGIGLRKSLEGNPHLDVSDDKRAINYALMPAVSGKAFRGSRVKQKGPWANSGFGLYMTSRICRNGGTFFIASGETGMLLTKQSQAKQYFRCRFQGTAIRMVMKTDQTGSLKDALELYRREGYAIQSRYKEIVNIDPSSASLMLSEDFDLSVWERILSKLKPRGKS
jgi:hypothetical protein